jgi:hypothetical protein
MKRFPLACAVALALAFVTIASAPAGAVPPVLRPGTRPWFFAGKLGGAFNMRHPLTKNCYGPNCPGIHQFKIGVEIGTHFTGKGEGPALSFVDFGASFGSEYGYSNWSIEVGPRFFWDIQLVRGMGLYLTPGMLFGFGAQGVKYQGDISAKGLAMQITFDGKLALGDRGFVFVRPFGLGFLILDFSLPGYAANWDVQVRWDFLFGGGVAF